MDQQAFELLMQSLSDIKEDISALRTEVEGLKRWRWKRLGAEGIVFTILSAAVSVATIWVESKR